LNESREYQTAECIRTCRRRARVIASRMASATVDDMRTPGPTLHRK